MKKISLVIALISLSFGIHAQITMPQPSPLSTVSQKIGLTDVSITYSRPSAKGRKVYGDLVPFDKLWRTGANKCTKITVNDTVKINQVKMGPGDYSLFAVPSEKVWMIVINKDATLSGITGYDESKDVTRFKVNAEKCPFTETFTINFSDLTLTSANIEITWETTKVSFKIESDPDAKVMKNIDQSLQVNPVNYYQAARYYMDTNRDLKQALVWIDQAISGGYNKYWVLRQKSLIQAGLGDYKGAIATANESKTMAQKDGNDDYVKMNEASIKEWEKK